MNSADQVLAERLRDRRIPRESEWRGAVRAIEECGSLALRETGLERSAIPQLVRVLLERPRRR